MVKARVAGERQSRTSPSEREPAPRKRYCAWTGM